jgi:hypothetical protein
VPNFDRLKRRCNLFHEFNETKGVVAADRPFSVLGEVIKVLEYAGMGCIFLGLIIIDGRALNLVKRLNGRRAIGKREEAASKAAS